MQSRLTRHLLSGILLPALLIGAFLAGRQLLGSVYHAFVLNSDLTQPGAATLEASRLATALDPDNVEYLHLQAFLESARGDSAAALESLHRSLTASPAWPHTWAAMARHRANQGRYDERMHTALARSQELGPQERSVQFTNAVVGIDHWYRLPPALREQVEPSIVYALTHESTRTMHGYIGGTGRQHLYCRRFARIAGGEEWCRKHDLPIGPAQDGQSQ